MSGTFRSYDGQIIGRSANRVSGETSFVSSCNVAVAFAVFVSAFLNDRVPASTASRHKMPTRNRVYNTHTIYIYTHTYKSYKYKCHCYCTAAGNRLSRSYRDRGTSHDGAPAWRGRGVINSVNDRLPVNTRARPESRSPVRRSFWSTPAHRHRRRPVYYYYRRVTRRQHSASTAPPVGLIVTS